MKKTNNNFMLVLTLFLFGFALPVFANGDFHPQTQLPKPPMSSPASSHEPYSRQLYDHNSTRVHVTHYGSIGQGLQTPGVHMPPPMRPNNSYELKTYGRYSATVYNGSLRANVARILTHFGWRHIIWASHFDYHWVGRVTLHDNSVQGIMGQLLAGYPLQAIFYKGNRVVLIKPRAFA